MNTDWWIIGSNIGVAVGTIMLAAITWRTLRHVVKEYRNRQLDEIVEWAIDTTKCDIYVEEPFPATDDLKFWKSEATRWEVQLANLKSVERKGRAIQRVVVDFKQPDLRKSVNSLMEEIGKHLSLICSVFASIPPGLKDEKETDMKVFVNANNEVVTHKQILDDSASNVINEISNIKGTS